MAVQVSPTNVHDGRLPIVMGAVSDPVGGMADTVVPYTSYDSLTHSLPW
jgi:hypothetical protein